ncbi:uncharacterized protein BXIN_0931 [Babesia sp. Xinjiang]|uniref:uncharacterized protein n=1 Tax=Babesia sp. Xinjiang TaxID=462227 RepID=UPI000A2292AE|nr:uncharacterized protein BXIN_0931 [Babesia sp. Xinjiang]ORM42063.1 hypothetical protein BXIN_0931 [Babesia sp. Xinjiang]
MNVRTLQHNEVVPREFTIGRTAFQVLREAINSVVAPVSLLCKITEVYPSFPTALVEMHGCEVFEIVIPNESLETKRLTYDLQHKIGMELGMLLHLYQM